MDRKICSNGLINHFIKLNINELSNRFGFDYRGLYPTLLKVLEHNKPSQGLMFPTLITQYSCGNSFEQSVKTINAQFFNHYQL